jgi:hypothetical protein
MKPAYSVMDFHIVYQLNVIMTGSFRDECAASNQICLVHLALCWLPTSKFIQERHLDLVNFSVDLTLRINNEDMFLCSDICGSDVKEITVSLKLLGSR